VFSLSPLGDAVDVTSYLCCSCRGGHCVKLYQFLEGRGGVPITNRLDIISGLPRLFRGTVITDLTWAEDFGVERRGLGIAFTCEVGSSMFRILLGEESQGALFGTQLGSSFN
jgi:hypothetical protein